MAMLRVCVRMESRSDLSTLVGGDGKVSRAKGLSVCISRKCCCQTVVSQQSSVLAATETTRPWLEDIYENDCSCTVTKMGIM